MLSENDKKNNSVSIRRNHSLKNNSIKNTSLKNQKNLSRPNSSVKTKREIKPYGVTALENIRKTYDKLLDKRESDLYSSLQQRIKVEYIKQRTFDNYNYKQKKLDNYQKELHIKKQNDFNEKQDIQNERLLNHYFLYENQKKLKNDQINTYKLIYQQKEDQINYNNLKKAEKLKEKIGIEDEKIEEVQYRYNCLNEVDKKRRDNLDEMMKEKDKEVKIKLAKRACEKKYYLNQKDMEKKEEIKCALEIIKRNRILFNKTYEKKQEKDKEKMDRLFLKKNEKKKEREINNLFRVEEHEFRYNQIKNEEDLKRNHHYFEKLKLVEKNKKLIQEKKEQEKEKKRQIDEEKKDMIRYNLNNCEIALNQFKENTVNKILEREQITKNIMDIMKSKEIEKQEEDYNLEKERELKIKQMRRDDSLCRDKERENLDKKAQKINEFLAQKELMSQKKIKINDNFNEQYKYYTNKIDNLMCKRPMDKVSLNHIKDIVSDNPNLSGIVQNLEPKNK